MFLFVLSLNVYGIDGCVSPVEKAVITSALSDTCSLKAIFTPGSDTVVSIGNTIILENQSLNSNSIAWFINGSFTSSQTDLIFYPSSVVNEIMLVAYNGVCTDTAYSYIILNGNVPGQYNNFQKQYHPADQAMEPFCLTNDKSNGYLLAGDYYVPSENSFVTRTTSLVHIDEKGCIDWSKSMIQGEEQVIQSAISTYDSGYLITSFPFQSSQDNYPNELNVFKLDRLGNREWAHSFSNGTSVNNYYSAMCETHDNNIVIEIGSFPVAGNPSAISIIKIDPLGRFIWGRKLSMENNAYYNIGGIVEKNNFIYATGSIYEGVAPFQVIRSFLVQIDEVTGLPVWTKQNNPGIPLLSFTDIHNYKNGLLLNSYSQNLLNNLIYMDNDGNILSGIKVVNPYGSLSGIENVLVTPDNGFYFHQASGKQGVNYKDIIMRVDSNQQIAWQYDFSSKDLNFTGWYQLSGAPANGVAGIGSGIMANGFNALTFLKLDSSGAGCNSGGTNLSLEANQVSLVPMTWSVNSDLSTTVGDVPLNLEDVPLESHLFCPKYLDGCDLLKLNGPRKLCHAGDTARYILHTDPFCSEPINWTYDSQYITVVHANHSYLDLEFKKSGNFLIKVDKNGCNRITDSILVSVGNVALDASLPKDTILCAGNALKLDAGSGYTNYLWQDGTNKQSIEVVDSGTYWVRITDEEGCINTDTAIISSIEALPFSFLPHDTVICTGENLILQPVRSYESYSWSTGETGNSIQIKDQGKYTLQVIDKYGCSGTDTIMVKTKSCPLEIFFPNAFSPNKDGLNDTYKPITIASPVVYEFRIYNRWGQLVFETSDPKKGWDGMVGNVAQETDSYVWMCTYQFSGGKKNVISGTVILMR
ncbi:MAG TPA: gliding motility-associated C-terminal domain-containing protein [Puia sp.]|nr:gliding motility-associated C-terminal domain-containing protein [Puia sp.]